MRKLARKNVIHGQQAGEFSRFHDEYGNKRKIGPPIGGDMADSFPLITLLDEPAGAGDEGARLKEWGWRDSRSSRFCTRATRRSKAVIRCRAMCGRRRGRCGCVVPRC